jgi:hypothetical protein
MWQIIMMQAYNDCTITKALLTARLFYSPAILQSEFTTLDSNMYGRLHRGKRAREIAQINLGICKMEWAVNQHSPAILISLQVLTNDVMNLVVLTLSGNFGSRRV